ncbi:hypothetical protein BDR26DRAFT_995375 [Obelidium mucronatum]|nr:hypothetical protein BDR26DRAFT_995375 [Obelidium mucronatum]
MRHSTRQRQAAATAATAATASSKHTAKSASSINPISAIRACPAAPAEIRIYTLPDCKAIGIPPACQSWQDSIPAILQSFISGFFDPLEQWELQHAAFSAPIMLCQPINHYRHSPLHQDYGTAINVLLQSPTNQQLFKLWVVLVPSDPTAIIPTLYPLSFAQAMALEVGPSCTYTARICFVKRPGNLSVIPSGYPHAVITVSTTKDATSIMGGAQVIFPKDYLVAIVVVRSCKGTC